jgi:hypothetical protein
MSGEVIAGLAPCGRVPPCHEQIFEARIDPQPIR